MESQAARWTAVVLLPTPPLLFAIAIIMHRRIARSCHDGKQYFKQAIRQAVMLAYMPVNQQAIWHASEQDCQ
jgi:hypothetical protein